MVLQHSNQKSVVVVDSPTTHQDIIFRHQGCAGIVSEQTQMLTKSRLTTGQPLMAIFYDKEQHVVGAQILREQRKWISGVGYQLGGYVPFHAGRIHCVEAGGVALTFRKVMTCDTHYLHVKLVPFLLLAQPQVHVQPSHPFSAQGDVASGVGR